MHNIRFDEIQPKPQLMPDCSIGTTWTALMTLGNDNAINVAEIDYPNLTHKFSVQSSFVSQFAILDTANFKLNQCLVTKMGVIVWTTCLS